MIGPSSLSILGVHDSFVSSSVDVPLVAQDAPGTPDTTFGSGGKVKDPSDNGIQQVPPCFVQPPSLYDGKKFTVKEGGRGGALIDPVSQREAIQVGRMLARANRSELYIQGRNGRIRARDSHGFDSYPPKG